MNYRARCRDRTCDIRLVRAIASNNINSLSTAERAETGLFEGIRGTSGAQLIRAVIRCECLSCGTHKSRCTHIAGRRVSRTRHPVVLHRVGDRVLCHICLNRKLELECRVTP